MRNISVKLICIWTSGLGGEGHLKIFLIYSSGGLSVQCFQITCAIMIVGIMPNISNLE